MPSREPHWPKRWTWKHGAIWYRTRPDDRHLWNDQSWFRLGATEAEAWACWFDRAGTTPSQPLQTIGDAIQRYRGEVLTKKAPKTQRDYDRALKRLEPVFGRMHPAKLRPVHVARYMDLRVKADGTGTVAANRDKAVLSAVMTCCVRWGLIDRNLVREISRFEETPRERYVEDAELDAFLEHCRQSRTKAGRVVAAFVRLKLLTSLRQGQIRQLHRAWWKPARNVLSVPSAKGGLAVEYEGPELADAIEELQDACAVGRGIASVYLAPTRSGAPYTDTGFQSLWQRTMRSYLTANPGARRFTEHDLRAKVVTDEQDLDLARRRAGHRSVSTTQRHYRVRPERVPVSRARLQATKSGGGDGEK